MLETFKNFGGKKLGGLILIIVIIIAFGFGGFGGGFSTNNQNNIAKINKTNVTTQDFMDYVNQSGISQDAIRNNLENIISSHKIDFTIINGENSADDGKGITKINADEFFSYGVDVITSGNHIWDKQETIEFISKEKRLLRPANLAEGSPGEGYGIYFTKDKKFKIGVINLMGNVFMRKTEDVFEVAKKIKDKVILKKDVDERNKNSNINPRSNNEQPKSQKIFEKKSKNNNKVIKTNHMKDILKIVPGIGLANIALNQYISSIGKVGKSAFTITMAILRTINIVPNVAIKDGIPNLIVIVALIYPITRHINKAIVNAR